MALDAEVLVVAGHAPHWHRKAPSLIDVQIVVAARLVLADAKRVTHEIAGHEDEIGTPSLGDGPNLLQANEALRTDVRVRRVDEREGRGGRAGGQGKIEGRAARRWRNRFPETSDGAMIIGKADEHHARSGTGEPVGAVGATLDDLVLIGDGDARKAALTRIAESIAVDVLEHEARYRRWGLRGRPHDRRQHEHRSCNVLAHGRPLYRNVPGRDEFLVRLQYYK